jgi:hypothetical protein
VTSGKSASYDSFTYGDALWISGNAPTEGNAGDLVIIYGSGFEDPLQVFLGGELMELVSVSGTELVIRIPDQFEDDCSAVSGAFTVVLLESNLETSGGNFTILGNEPLVISAEPLIFYEQDSSSDPNNGFLDPTDLTIIGQDFAGQDRVQVQVGSYNVPNSDLSNVSSTSIDVDLGPPVRRGDILVDFDTSPCVTTGLVAGVRNVATAVNVEVANLPGLCSDTLLGAFLIEPYDTECVSIPSLAVAPLTLVFGPLDLNGGSASESQPLDITNNGSLPLNWTAALEGGTSCTQFSLTQTSGGPLSLATQQIDVTYDRSAAPAVHDDCRVTVTAVQTDANPRTQTVTLRGETIDTTP